MTKLNTDEKREQDREFVEDTQQAIADDLGVVQQTVSRAIDELPESVKRTQLSKVNTDEKREQKRDVTPPFRTKIRISRVVARFHRGGTRFSRWRGQG